MADATQWLILVVEDEPDGQEVVATLLGNFNITVNAVFTAEEALRLLEKNTYTAAVIDLALPGMDGLSLIKKIREKPETAKLPCVAITAFHSSLVRHHAVASGFDGYFSKPLDDISFVRELKQVIEKAN